MPLNHTDHQKNNNSDKSNEIRNLADETAIRNLLDKTEKILRVGGLPAEALTILIVGFHRRAGEETD